MTNKPGDKLSNDEFSTYFLGEKLYGDDFSIEQIANWYETEKEGYANLGANDRDKYRYEYHELNKYHCFKYVDENRIPKTLGLGSAYGEEFEPILQRLDQITVLDPSDVFAKTLDIKGTPCEYVKPNVNGDLPFDNDEFNLITCFGVIHHIPNVSHVINECYRCLKVGGKMLIREPIVSQGDWRKPRVGVTQYERGIPLPIFDEIIRRAGFTVISRSLCDFSPLVSISGKLGLHVFNSRALVFTDAVLSRLFSSNISYHRTNVFKKFAPASVAFVLEK